MSKGSVLYKMVLQIAGARRVVVAINHQEKVQSKSVEPLHYIHIIDRSHSLQGEIADLVENVKRTRAVMRPGDKLSVIWFAGENQCSVLLKGASGTDDIDALLDTLKSTCGTTCFSVPLMAANQVVDDLATISPHFLVTLFTDGNPVVTEWSYEEEERRIHSILDVLGPKVIALNTIGYGTHYNQELLIGIANTSQYGLYTHSSNIDDYETIFGHNFERLNDLNIGNIDVKAPGHEILYIGDKNARFQADSMKLTALSKIRNQVFVLGPDEHDFTFEYNGDVYNSADIKSPKLLPTTLRNFYYGLAFGYYYHGKREQALDILVLNLGDKALVDSHMNAFTYEEVSNQSEKLRKAIFKTKLGLYRYRNGVCTPNYIPREDATCVMDILRILAAGDNDYVAPIGRGRKYKRIGAKIVDVFGTTNKIGEESVSPFQDNMILNEDKCNVSFRVRSRVDVTINKRQAERVGLAIVQNCYQYRSYAVVCDGHLNQEEIEAIIDQPTFGRLTSLGVNMLVVRPEANNRHRVVISFENVPTINRMYAKATIDDVFASVKNVTELKTAQKVLNFYLGNTEKAVGVVFYREANFIPLNEDQIQVLKDHGINPKMEYNAVQAEREFCGDSYETRVLDFGLAKFSSLPKVEEVMEKFNKACTDIDLNVALMKYEGDYARMLQAECKFTPSQAMMANYVEELNYEANSIGIKLGTLDAKQFLKDRLKDVKVALIQERINLNLLKMGKILTGGWFEGLEPDGKGGFTFTKGGYTVVVKTKREIVHI